MDRLTANKDTSKMSMVELAHNCCYAKDGKARYRDFDKDIDARDFARRLMQKYGFWEGEDYRDLLSNNDTFDEAMIENLYYGEDSLEGLIALFYRNLWVMADLHNRLKAYEDTGLAPEKILELDKMYQELSKEVMQYRALGTLEELREAMEKQVPKKPIRNDLCTCPSCGTHNEVIKKRRNTVNNDIVYCWHCGQAMEVNRLE